MCGDQSAPRRDNASIAGEPGVQWCLGHDGGGRRRTEIGFFLQATISHLRIVMTCGATPLRSLSRL